MKQVCQTTRERFHTLITLAVVFCLAGQVAAKLKHQCQSLELKHSSTSTVLANENECGKFCAQLTVSLGKSVQLEDFYHTYVPDACQKEGGTCQYESVQWDQKHKSCYCERSLIMVRVSKADVRAQDGTVSSCNPNDITERLYKSLGGKLPVGLQLKVTRSDVHCHSPPRDHHRALVPCRCNEFGEVLAQVCSSTAHVIVLAPVTSSLNLVDRDTGIAFVDSLNDDFLASHILRVVDQPHERAKARNYTTLNGKTVVIKDDAVFPHRGFKGVKEVKLLHDALFWLDDSKSRPILVYFLNKPLIGNPGQPRPVPGPFLRDGNITNWQELCARYRGIATQLDPTFRKLFNSFQDNIQADGEVEVPSRTRASSLSSIRPASLRRHDTEHSFSQDFSLIQLRLALDEVLSSAIGAFQELPRSLLHRIGLETSLAGTDIEDMIESHCLTNLYDLTLHRLSKITAYKDEEVSQAMEQCKHADLTQLGTRSTLDIRNRLVLATEAFATFTTSHTPNAKLQALLNTIHILMTHSEKSSDDLIPCLVAVLLRSSASSSWANILLIREFSFSDVEMGERGFALSTLEAVLYHIASSANSLSLVSSRNKQFFEAVEANDIEDVKKSLADHPELLEIRNLQNQTPLQLASPQMTLFMLSLGCSASALSHALLRHLSTSAFEGLLRTVADQDPEDARTLLNQQDESGQTLAHKVCDHMDIIFELSDLLDWRHRDKSGCTPLLVLARIYDHPLYEELLETTLSAITTSQFVDDSSSDDASFELPKVIRRISLTDHIDPKGNTLAHIVSTRTAMEAVFKYCQGDFNSLNDKGLSPLLISIKFARQPILDFLLSRPEVDGMGRDDRGHSAIHYAARASLPLFNTCVRHYLDINDRASGSGFTPLHITAREGNMVTLKRLLELDVEDAWDWRGFRPGDVVKNDQVRAILDEWACHGKEVSVLRGHVGEDCTVKYLIKIRNGGGVLRSVADFVNLRHWLTKRYSALGIATLAIHTPAPCLLHSRPARSVLLAVTERLDAFVQSLLAHPIIRKSQILWEFLLSPTRLDVRAVQDTIDREVHADLTRIWQEEKPLTDFTSAELFFQHAREQILVVSSSYQVFERKARAVRDGQLHVSVAFGLLGKGVDAFLPELDHGRYAEALLGFSDCLAAREPSLLYRLIEAVISVESKAAGILQSLVLPTQLVDRIRDHSTDIERGNTSLARNSKFALGLLADSRARQKAQITANLQELHLELNHASCELRRTETVLADALSQFYEQHARTAKLAVLNFCKTQVKDERSKLVGMQRCLQRLRHDTPSFSRVALED